MRTYREARESVGLAVQQCPECRGAGCTKATMPLSLRAIRVLAVALPDEPVAVVKETCRRCDGEGWIAA